MNREGGKAPTVYFLEKCMEGLKPPHTPKMDIFKTVIPLFPKSLIHHREENIGIQCINEKQI